MTNIQENPPKKEEKPLYANWASKNKIRREIFQSSKSKMKSKKTPIERERETNKKTNEKMQKYLQANWASDALTPIMWPSEGASGRGQPWRSSCHNCFDEIIVTHWEEENPSDCEQVFDHDDNYKSIRRSRGQSRCNHCANEIIVIYSLDREENHCDFFCWWFWACLWPWWLPARVSDEDPTRILINDKNHDVVLHDGDGNDDCLCLWWGLRDEVNNDNDNVVVVDNEDHDVVVVVVADGDGDDYYLCWVSDQDPKIIMIMTMLMLLFKMKMEVMMLLLLMMKGVIIACAEYLMRTPRWGQ